ncbi:MAG: SGNH/GDSL hydrolase family protein [Chlorobiota bacterium]|jgi:lysophospholipase L1-like esterase|nr:SGNH/GDSL hydrolase family protein [Chlorobiota bacterium]QQS67854.1 MAG: SGNH/GDSL hydrolase family protein [Chlorobiota bacterium]
MKYLALGDSYTIGEGVPEDLRFPMQLSDSLRKYGVNVNDPEVIAKTGWTTDELQLAIDATAPPIDYSLVTLLIGVNNQYRNYQIEDYREQFTILLKRSIAYAQGNPKRVIVISIPDWGVTPFAEGRDRALIAREIDEYNKVNKSVSEEYKVRYVDITEISRKYGNDPSMVTTDGLHPSPKLYAIWVSQILESAKKSLK